MANTRISDLVPGAAVSDTDLIPDVQVIGVGPVKVTGAQIKTYTSASPTLVTPNLGTPTAGVLTNCTGLPLTTGITGILAGTNGGTGVNNSTRTFTYGGNVTFSGAFTFTATLTGNTSVTFPTSGTLATTAGTVASFSAGSTGLTPNTATTGAVTLAGTLNLTSGGTNASLTASNGGIFYSTATAGAILSGTATAGQILQSGASSAPSWSTATFPSTATGTGTILRADGTNWSATTSTYPTTTSAGTFLVSATANAVTASATPTLGVQQTTQGKLTLANTAAGAFPVTLQSSNTTSAAWSLTLPTTAGTNNYVLTTNGSGVSSWSQVSLTAGVTGVLPVANGGTNASSAGITAFNNITGYSASGATGTTSTNLVFSTSPTLTTPVFTGLPTGTGVASAATASTLASRDSNANSFFNNIGTAYATTATAAGTTTLTAASARNQFFTGTTTQTVKLPQTSTIATGVNYLIVNKSTGIVTVQSNGSNTVTTMQAGTSAIITCISTSVDTAAAWYSNYSATGTTWTSYTPTVSAGTGSLGTNPPTATGAYYDVGTLRFIDATVTFPANYSTGGPTASNYLGLTIPSAPTSNMDNGLGREIAVVGDMLRCLGFSGNTTVRITKLTDGTFLAGNSYVEHVQFYYRTD